MNPIKNTADLLDRIQDFLAIFPGGYRHLPQLAQLKIKLHEPCVLAIAGRVKAGKSSFLNALLGENLAKVGELETTATINRFSYGVPDDPLHPVKVVWEGGMVTYESRDFMDSLQGHDEDTLRKAQGISYLEFRVQNEILKEITLVDTPGTDAIVGSDGDAHQAVTETFFNLRKKHSVQTQECTSSADAVIYLVGPVATAIGRNFLDEFRETSCYSTALNAVGVMSKVDIDQTLLSKRHEQAEYVARSLREQLNTVIPVSAGMYEALQRHRKDFPEWQKKMKRIPPKAFLYFMKQEATYLTDRQDVLSALYKTGDSGEYASEPISLEERKELRGDLFWSLFRTIAIVLYETESCDAALEQLKDIANIDGVKEVIQEQFLNRSKFIRCYRILMEVKKMLDDVKRNDFHRLRLRSQEKTDWEHFIQRHQSYGEQEIAESLLQMIAETVKSETEISDLEERFRKELVIALEDTLYALEEYDSDYRMLQVLQSCRDNWSEEDYEELCHLFGLYGARKVLEGRQIYERQQYWTQKSLVLFAPRLKALAEYATEIYGVM